MVSGHLQPKNGIWYAVLELRRSDGSRYSKWIPTKLKIQGNKKRAEEMLLELRRQYTLPDKESPITLFTDYLQSWLQTHKAEISVSTFASYSELVRGIVKYFEPQKLLLGGVKPVHIERFYQALYEQGLCSNSVLHYHTVLHKAFADAARRDILPRNPIALVKRPSKGQFTADPYTPEEMKQLFAAIEGDPLELVIKLTAYYGLRRSEVAGLRWQAIDFVNGTIAINHTVVVTKDPSGNRIVIGRNTVKHKSSNRKLPMSPQISQMLLDYQETKDHKALKPTAYLFTTKDGSPLDPDHITDRYRKLLKKHNLRMTRFHDLRHASASALVANRVPLVEVQQWLGHSTIRITADLYTHLAYQMKERSAAVLSNLLFENDKEEPINEPTGATPEQT